MSRNEEEMFDIPSRVRDGAHVDQGLYEELYKHSIDNPDEFWGEQAKKQLDWFQPFNKVSSGSFEEGDIKWFLNGKMNACYNCVDRHLETKADKVAIIFEGDEPDQIERVTYRKLHEMICRMANLMKSIGLKKGDTAAIYLPNIPEAAAAMLACARIGVIHTVVFAGFSADALASRINDAECKLIITADETVRGKKVIPLKPTVDAAVATCPSVEHVFVLKRDPNAKTPFSAPRDIWLAEEMAKQSTDCPCEPLDSEDILFLLYTSGSTGTPKGIIHTQAGFLLYVMLSFKLTFDYRESDIYGCMADIGWATGHSYIIYGPLACGATTFMFEGVPYYPSPSRYWDMVDRHQINQFYTAPTAIRHLMRSGDEPVKGHKLDSLRVLGSVGEPINPEAWKWYHDVVGRKRCAVVDTYWQTESGGHIITPLPGATKTKPGSATLPFFGIELAVLDPQSGKRLHDKVAEGVLAVARPWPGIARSVYKDHGRYLKTYMQPYPGYYFSGDGVSRDSDGYYWISGRVDDVINVSGHRIGTAEIESALTKHPMCAEAAVVGIPHDVKGQGIAAYCILRSGHKESPEAEAALRAEIRRQIGPFANPDLLIFTSGLPKTRSGKIMRRILRKIAAGETSPESLGDISTLADPDVVPNLIKKIQKTEEKKGI